MNPGLALDQPDPERRLALALEAEACGLESVSLDHASGGRRELAIACADDDAPRVAEALTRCKQWWCDPRVEDRGARIAPDGVAPSERPQQRPGSPLHVTGVGDAALGRLGAKRARAGASWPVRARAQAAR